MSGSTIGGVLGAAIGYWVSGGDTRATQAGWMIGSAVGGYVDPDVIPGQRLNDAQTQTVAEGAPRPIVYGTAVVAGNCIMAGPLVEHENKDRVGKGGSQVQQSFTYTRTYAIRVCEGPTGNISRIWRDDKLVYDVRDPAQWPDQATAIRNMAGDTAKFATGISIYNGDETQLPDPSLESLPAANGGGVGEVNAYRGTCYVVFTDDDLTDRQGALPQYRFEVSCCGTATTSQADVPWVHGTTGSLQTVYATAIEKLTAIAAGDNDNLRITHDGGRTWDAIDYITPTGWSGSDTLVAVWHDDEISNETGTWYIAKSNKIAVSYDNGGLFTEYLTPQHDLQGRVFRAAGADWAGAAATTNTIIFQPLVDGPSDIDLGVDYGNVLAIGDIGGGIIVSTDDGYIVRGVAGGAVVYHDSSHQVTQFADSGTVVIAACVGGYLRSTDAGATWTFHGVGTVDGVVYARGRFYFLSSTSISISDDGLTLTTVDTYFSLNPGGSFITTDGYSILAVTQFGDTASLPSAYLLPDLASGWHIDELGNVVGDTNTSVDRCVAQLDETVLDICERVGLTAAQVDVSALVGVEVRGFVIGQQMPAADALRSLQQYYFFDLPEWGDYTDTSTKLRAILRGSASVFAITDDDLVQSDDDEDTRAQVVEFPRKLNLVTSDVDSDYNPTKQTAERRTDNIKAVGEASFTLPIVTIRTEAAPKADIMLKVAWEEALGRTQFILPAEFSRLTPSDCFTKGSKRWRAEKCEYGDGTVSVEAVRDRVSAYTSNASPSDAPAPSDPPSSLRGPTEFVAFNSPALRTSESTTGMQIGVCGRLDGWIGCDLYLSVDGGLSEQLVATYLTETTMGSLTSACDSGTTDLIAVKVVHNHELDSVTAGQIALRANSFAIITNGTAEIFQAQTATETAVPVMVDETPYDLTDLTRGGLGTTPAVHVRGDRFVALDGLHFLQLNASLAGRTLIFRPVSRGTALANNQTYSVVFAPLFTSAPTIDFYETELGEVITTEASEYLQVD